MKILIEYFDCQKVSGLRGRRMYRIVAKEELNSSVTKIVVEAPLVARKAEPGQFIILRVDDDGERIPLTIADYDREKGTVTIIFQIVGATTNILNQKQVGESIKDFVGPLGKEAETNGYKNVCIVGGGVGCAIALPIAKKFHELGAKVTSIVGFRSKDIVILEEDFKKCSDKLFVLTDDGTYGTKGNVTAPLKDCLDQGEKFDLVITIGPLIMMKFVVLTCKPYGVPVTVSMNPIMVDGTGMCGGCRLTLLQDGERVTKFACVDGPDFNGYEIDFDEAMSRGRMYQEQDRHANTGSCNLFSADKDNKSER